jgi:hypothetical protein
MRTRGSSSSPFSLFAFQDIITSVIAIVILITMILALELVSRVSQVPQSVKEITEDNIRSAKEEMSLITQEIHILKNQIKAAGPIITSAIGPKLHPTELKKQIERLTRLLEALDREVSSIEKGPTGPALPLKELKILAEKVQFARNKFDFIQSNNAVIYAPDDNAKRNCWVIILSSQQIEFLPITEGLPARTLRDSSGKQLINKLKQALSSLAKDENYFLLAVRPTAGPDLYFDVIELLQNDNYRVGVEFMPEDVRIFTQSNFDKGIGL